MRRQRGFTLIELLVVIGIIGILLSILIPTVNGIRKRVKESECANNQRQIYNATMLVVKDLNGQLPRPALIGETYQANESGPNKYRDFGMFMLPGQNGGQVDYKLGGLLLPYLGRGPETRQAIFYCPMDRGERPHLSGTYQGVERNFSYSYNRRIRPKDDPSVPDFVIRLDQVRKPGSRIMVYEEVGPNDLWCSEPGNNSDDWPTNRHARGGKVPSDNSVDQAEYKVAGSGNHLFFDGHVETLTPLQVMTGSSTAGGDANTSYYTPLDR